MATKNWQPCGACNSCRTGYPNLCVVGLDPLPGDPVKEALNTRGEQYGGVGGQSRLFTSIMDAMGKTGHVSGMDPVFRQSLYMIALKMSRIVCGNPDNKDSWLDIEGYARLAREACK